MSKLYRYYFRVIASLIVIFSAAFFIALGYRFYRSNYYKNAKELLANCDYYAARERFEELGDYRDCTSYLALLSAIDYVYQEQYEEAIAILQSLGDFEGASNRLFDAQYDYANKLYREGNFNPSVEILTQLSFVAEAEMKTDIDRLLNNSKYAYAQQLFSEKDYSQAIEIFSQMDYSSAIAPFEELDDFGDSKKWLNRSKYALALELKNQNDVLTALNYFLDLGNYEKSAQYVEEILGSVHIRASTIRAK